MLIIPAIDILGGECVRLYKGDYTQATVYEKDPVAMAREFERLGAKRIHIVDLDAARGGGKRNRKKIRKIRKAVSCTLQLGGGIRDEEDVEELIDLGIDRLVVGTLFARNPSRVAGWIQHYGPVFLAGIDAKDGKVQISGWERATDIDDAVLAERAKEAGIAGIVYTNISKDGTMEGPDIEATERIARVSGLPVILSGGIGGAEDIEQVVEKKPHGVVGIITGKAVYEEKFDLPEVLEKFQDDTAGEEDW
jgi:phosphoribosylformimino-5-aminoimidazole carboxamide ribotide isomerase